MEEEWELAVCPYNSTHRVPRHRIQGHIIKCAKKYPPLAICPYNATHRFPFEQLKMHCKNCPNKSIELIEDKPLAGGKITVPQPLLQRDYLPETDPNHECWDD